MSYIVPLLFFYVDSFGIEYSRKVDMPLNKKKPNQISNWIFKENVFFRINPAWLKNNLRYFIRKLKPS